MIGIDVSPLQIFATVITAAFLLMATNCLANRRARREMVRISNESAETAIDSFLEGASHDQPVIEMWERAVRSLCGELVFVDARLERSVSTDIPVYDLKSWNSAHHKDLPRLIHVDSKGIAVKFEHPGIWYEMVFTSRRGFGTLTVRRYMLAAVCNRVEELLAIQQQITNHRASD